MISKIAEGVLRALRSWLLGCRPGILLLVGYGLYIAIGALLLALPFMRNGQAGEPLDCLFTAASAVSTTGLVTISTGHDFTWGGQFVILLLIQMGGLGYMTLGSFTILAVSNRLDPWRAKVARIALNLPNNFNAASFLKLIVAYSIVVEAIGAIWLYLSFSRLGVENAAWSAIFHSISAFCTAGFSLYDDSFMGFRDDLSVNLALIMLSYLGGLGFIVVNDIARSIYHRKAHLTLTTKIIISSTAVISLVGVLGFVVEEPLTPWNTGDGWLTAWFQVMTASTTVGFNTVNIAELSSASAFLLLLCMLIGASPSGTGGGIKTTSLTVAWAMLTSVLRGRSQPVFLGREIPEARRRLAVATIFFYIIMLSFGIYCLAWVESATAFDLIFECASALGTVGLSRGITADLSSIGKGIIIVLMMAGRIGPLMLASALFTRKHAEDKAEEAAEEVWI